MNIQKKPKTEKVRNIILDLDETLISAVEIPPLLKSQAKMEEFNRRAKLFRVHKLDNDYYIAERPGVQTFLDYVFQHFNVSVWTAASKDYAIFVVDKVVQQRPGRKLDYFLYSDNCDASYERSGCLKQLNQLFHLPQYNRENTMIIDDNDNVKQQANLVKQIKPFRLFQKQSEQDQELTKIVQLLKRNIQKPHK